jgi:hypothetical protein
MTSSSADTLNQKLGAGWVVSWLYAYKDVAYTVMALELFMAAMVFGLIYFRMKEFRGTTITFMVSQAAMASFYYGLTSFGAEGVGLWLGHLLFQAGMAGTVIRTLQMSNNIRSLEAGDACRGNRDVQTVATGGLGMFWAVFWLIYFSVATITPTETYISAAGWAVLQLSAFGLLGYSTHRSTVVNRGCAGTLAKISVGVVGLSLMAAGIYNSVATFGEVDSQDYVMWKLIWFMCLQMGTTALPLMMLMYMACKPPGVSAYHTRNGVDSENTPALLPPN